MATTDPDPKPQPAAKATATPKPPKRAATPSPESKSKSKSKSKSAAKSKSTSKRAPAAKAPAPRPGPATSATTRRRLLQREERRAQLLLAAARAFAQGGYDGTTLDEVASEAGVTKLILYRHFDGKTGLYSAVLAGVTERLREEYEAVILLPGGTVGQASVRALVRAARENPDAFHLLFVHAAREPEFRSYAEGFHQLSVSLADTVIGEAFADPVLRRWADRTMVDSLFASVLAWTAEAPADRDDEFVDRTLDGLRCMVEGWLGLHPAPAE